ncbi:MAG: nucleotide pyrophosphohydrolase [Candidatus Lokiarchaeota archaeon]|nr:nucleotide pyrophosphohydrolase [Candidatus Lokiarchaeota archaeon]
MKISDFQELMKTLYYHQDSKRGVDRTFIWLVEEIGELADLLKYGPHNLNLKDISNEMADIVAWTSSLANLLNIDLESALLEKYPKKCIKCNNNPCKCSSRNT